MQRGSRTWIGPGLPVVLRSIPGLLVPPIVIYTGLAIGCSLNGVESDCPRACIANPVLRILSVPLALWIYFSLGSFIKYLRRQQDRRSLGPDVIEPPHIKKKLPGNIDWIPEAIRARDQEYIGDMFSQYFPTHGHTFNMKIFGLDQVFTCDPECIKAVLSTDFNSFEKGKKFKIKMDTVLGVGVFNSDGDMWQLHRSMSRPYFHRERVTHIDLFAQHSDIAIKRLLTRLSEPGLPAVDFQDLVGRFTLDSATEFLFGSSTHSLDAPLPRPNEPPVDESATFAAAFGRAQELLMRRFVLGSFWPWFELFKDRTEGSMEVINAFTNPILQAKLREKREGLLSLKEKGNEGDTLLDHLVGFSDDERVIKDELLNILIAGRDTTAATLTFACYALAMYPECLAKLRAEVLATFGTSDYPTLEALRTMKYLRAFINEVLRVFPPVPFNERTAAKSTVFKAEGKKFYVPAGAQIPISIFHMHRRKDLWGPDAEEFDPERWLDERLKKYVTPNPFIFLPFSAGPRICLGQQFAYNESSYFLVRLLQRVDQITLAPDAQPPESHPPAHWKQGTGRKAIEKFWLKSHLTMYAVGGLWVRMREASDVNIETRV
ncbi:cytochrome P450 family monooxygenase pc-3 [Rhizoctonia solani 123E]|uniref:Cytochrome P450 family monooxygenase pc-3 n=2 Tax=Rhizoctonia solani TaxID=456999 RepID=A0A074RVJ7_9AGAM|nr:cytochrome P450 family monooxygenase pc-3 [Rhizoctonia solani 123E]